MKICVKNYKGFFISSEQNISTKKIITNNSQSLIIDVDYWPDEFNVTLINLFFRTIRDRPEFIIGLWNRDK